MLKGIYLDHNATAPLYPGLKAKIPAWLEDWGNPSSIHWAGRGPKAILREARKNIAALIGCDALEVIFTSGGSESNNLALKGALPERPMNGRDEVIVSAVEHPSVRKTAEALRARGYTLRVIGVNRSGELDRAELDRYLGESTALVSLMTANNETGHIFPVAEVARQVKAAGALMHTDAVQALGKLPVNVREMGVDLATFSGHKFYSLKGAGVLYVRKGLMLNSLIHGGGQERGRRGGTENVLAIAALGEMAKLRDQVAIESENLRRLRDHMENRILREISGSLVTGGDGLRLPNTSSLILPGVDGETLLMNLDVHGFAVSTGAACSSGSPEPSPVLLAMGLSRREAQSSLRLSLGWSTSREEVDQFVDVLKDVVDRLRSFQHGTEYSYGI